MYLTLSLDALEDLGGTLCFKKASKVRLHVCYEPTLAKSNLEYHCSLIVAMANQRMRGTIAIEEAVINPKFAEGQSKYKDVLSVYTVYDNTFPSKLVDIHGERLREMDEHGIDYMVLSMTSPGPQDVLDEKVAQEMAQENNDYLAAEVAKNPRRFGAFAQLSMHSATQAGIELRRAVKELGMVGALINDWQSTVGPSGGEVRLYYDTKEYDAFWSVAEELDVPVYLHPRYPLPEFPQEPWASRVQLQGAGVGFYLDLSWHLYALCSEGVFDRFPGLKVIVGHLGESIPLNLWRASYQYDRMIGSNGRKSVQNYDYYWHRNIFVTTSGQFDTRNLKYVVDVLGVDRVLFSIDYPYLDIQEGQEWWKGVDMPQKEKEMIGRGNAIRVLRLPLDP